MIRRATPADVADITGLIHELAEYEKEAASCTVTAQQISTALFGNNPSVFAHVAIAEDAIVGVALWFLNFSTWDGVNGIYLEDLFVQPAARGRGLGKLLLSALAAECVQRGYSRLSWAVLNWNTPSIGFYESVGAQAQDEWTTYRLSGDALTALAAAEGSAASEGSAAP